MPSVWTPGTGAIIDRTKVTKATNAPMPIPSDATTTTMKDRAFANEFAA
jgi:hypothetical protein